MAYISIRNARYGNVFWNISRGGSCHSDIIKLHIVPHFCIDSGRRVKIDGNLDIVAGSARMVSIDSTREMISVSNGALAKKSPHAILGAESEYRYWRANERTYF